VGRVTAFLALDGAKLITETTLCVDGGYHIIDRCVPPACALGLI